MVPKKSMHTARYAYNMDAHIVGSLYPKTNFNTHQIIPKYTSWIQHSQIPVEIYGFPNAIFGQVLNLLLKLRRFEIWRIETREKWGFSRTHWKGSKKRIKKEKNQCFLFKVVWWALVGYVQLLTCGCECWNLHLISE
jgi:hypothetical protein